MTSHTECSPILKETSLKFKRAGKELFAYDENDGLYHTYETELRRFEDGENLNLLTFEGDSVEMNGLGNRLNTDQLDFLVGFLRNKLDVDQKIAV